VNPGIFRSLHSDAADFFMVAARNFAAPVSG
jgi:hypothetical protein